MIDHHDKLKDHVDSYIELIRLTAYKYVDSIAEDSELIADGNFGAAAKAITSIACERKIKFLYKDGSILLDKFRKGISPLL